MDADYKGKDLGGKNYMDQGYVSNASNTSDTRMYGDRNSKTEFRESREGQRDRMNHRLK